MKRAIAFAFITTLYVGMACVGFAQGVGHLDNDGTTCQSAIVIASVPFSGGGFLDGDNDCVNPFPPPFNDVFYTITPTVSGSYTFRLQLAFPSTSVSIRVVRNQCCAGSVVMAFDSNLVAASCDTGITTYSHADLIAGTQYWIHAGDNSSVPHTSRYHLDVMHVTCPLQESTTRHDLCSTAQTLALGDSVRGDSAWATHPDWYKFVLSQTSTVTISEYGRAFGHCNSGLYPDCLVNQLDAHFALYCENACGSGGAVGDSIGQGEDEGCSTDAVRTFCLVPGTYFIKVANNGGGVIGAWTYILAIAGQPSTGCVPLSCTENIPCPGNIQADQVVMLSPDFSHIPGEQSTGRCIHLRPDLGDTSLTLVVLVENSFNRPEISFSAHCDSCVGLPLDVLSADSANWQYSSTPSPRFTTTLRTTHTSIGCTGCVQLEFILPVELTTLTATATDGHVMLNWATASESSVDRFDVLRNNIKVGEVRAVNSATGSRYSWTDDAVTNGTLYNYTLFSVDLNGTRQMLRSVSATPTVTAALITEYALRQNYPNPFNPSTSIGFDLLNAGMVHLKVYNVMGQQVANLVSGSMTAGRHTVTFNASTLPSGLYVYRLTTNNFVSEKKMLLMK